MGKGVALYFIGTCSQSADGKEEIEEVEVKRNYPEVTLKAVRGTSRSVVCVPPDTLRQGRQWQRACGC